MYYKDKRYAQLAIFEEQSPAGDSAAEPAGEATFTQSDLDALTATHTEALKTEKAERLKDINLFKSNTKLTKEENDKYAETVKNLEKQVMSADELRARDIKAIQTKSDEDLETANQRSDKWKSRYSGAEINRGLVDASVQHKAINPSQVEAILKGKTSIVEVLDDDGNVTDYKVLVKMTTKKKDKTIEHLVPPAEAVKMLKEDPKYFNLFEGEGVPGSGFKVGAPSKSKDVANMSMDEYSEYRKKQKGK